MDLFEGKRTKGKSLSSGPVNIFALVHCLPAGAENVSKVTMRVKPEGVVEIALPIRLSISLSVPVVRVGKVSSAS
jgi:hypothetical protein